MKFLRNSSERIYWIQSKWFSCGKYWSDPEVEKAKGRWFPNHCGKLWPSLDWQVGGGWAVNWFGIRFRWGRRR